MNMGIGWVFISERELNRVAVLAQVDDGRLSVDNVKFAKPPAKPDNLHRSLNIEPDLVAEVYCLRDNRYVTKGLTLQNERKRIQLEVNDLTPGLVGEYLDVYEMPDGRSQVRAKGVALPRTVFDLHQQRVTDDALAENKHLKAVHLIDLQKSKRIMSDGGANGPKKSSQSRWIAAELELQIEIEIGMRSDASICLWPFSCHLHLPLSST